MMFLVSQLSFKYNFRISFFLLLKKTWNLVQLLILSPDRLGLFNKPVGGVCVCHTHVVTTVRVVPNKGYTLSVQGRECQLF